MSDPLLALVGPTAVGKTALAVALAQSHRAEIVGVDASQVYQGLNVGTGKATAAELSGVPHHLIDVARPDEAFDAARYVGLADEAIAAIQARGHRVLLCGGTGLYLKALIHGLAPIPPVPNEIREALAAEIAAGGLPSLYAELKQVDPEAAARIHATDPQRIERALGVFRASGRPLSAWQAAHRFAPVRHHAIHLGLRCPLDRLTARIERRVARMFSGGLLDEVAQLIEAGYGPRLRSLSAIGYRYAAAVLEGAMPVQEARRLTVRDSRRYAKRQMTWFKALDGVHWIEAPDGATPEVIAEATDWLETHWPASDSPEAEEATEV